MKSSSIVCSYIFFALLVFDALALLSSEFSSTFSQVFALLSRDGRVYNFFLLLFTGFAIVFSALLPFAKMTNKADKNIISTESNLDSKSSFFTFIFMICMLCALVILFIYAWRHFFVKIDISQEIITESITSPYYKSASFFLLIGCGLLLCIFPLIYDILELKNSQSITPKIQKNYTKILLNFKPNLTTIIISLAGVACHPFFANLQSKWINLGFLCVASALLAYLLVKNSAIFGLYEYANIIFLCLSILCFVLCSESMVRSNFESAQNALFALAILCFSTQCLQSLQEPKS